ncbi:DegV family protein [Candidatus Oleimmundimicrobium sp.]|uniref:DegV family protein n=1 Tax=Candidatus Oleimmundimicrobium sp. TaxID=3060597 RepID=UPI00271B1208|nr:DegV family protein [Candidatus Oleimmundimicrobium sp.]MDO8885341.1 DegV family protein [Candidatus Oleimmundimicrobium sp.]
METENVSIVTDSTADFELSYYKEHDVYMVPLMVRFKEESFKDWVDIKPKEFYRKLKASDVLSKTSQPTVAQFEEVYKKLSRDHTHIISIHISLKLSGTVQSAQIASENINIPVTVIDGKSASLLTGILVDLAVKARDEGKTAEEIVQIVNKARDRAKILFVVDTLKYLHLGGRIGKAQALVGSLLKIKPILTLEDGLVAPYKKAKGTRKAIQEIVSIARENIDQDKPYRLVVAHADAPDNLAYLKELLLKEGFKSNQIIEGEVGAVIGTYTGPGAVALVYYQE